MIPAPRKRAEGRRHCVITLRWIVNVTDRDETVAKNLVSSEDGRVTGEGG